jgi:hypothetical protein
VGDIEDALAREPPPLSASTVKLRTRVGMGLCQGRMCEITVRRLIARRRACTIEEVAGYTVRAPVKPIPLSLLAADPGALDIDPESLR